MLGEIVSLYCKGHNKSEDFGIKNKTVQVKYKDICRERLSIAIFMSTSNNSAVLDHISHFKHARSSLPLFFRIKGLSYYRLIKGLKKYDSGIG